MHSTDIRKIAHKRCVYRTCRLPWLRSHTVDYWNLFTACIVRSTYFNPSSPNQRSSEFRFDCVFYVHFLRFDCCVQNRKSPFGCTLEWVLPLPWCKLVRNSVQNVLQMSQFQCVSSHGDHVLASNLSYNFNASKLQLFSFSLIKTSHSCAQPAL